MGNPNKVKVGPGLLYIAPLGTTEPTNLTTPWATVDSDWAPIGYTEEGHEFSSEPSFEPIEVAEELVPIRYEEANKNEMLSFNAAELTVDNLTRAFNGGAVTVLSGTVKRYEPPALGQAVRAMLGWESDDGEERWVFRKCVSAGNVTIARRKSPDKALIAMEFRLEVVAGLTPWTAILETA